jgi:hypothetical protein
MTRGLSKPNSKSAILPSRANDVLPKDRQCLERKCTQKVSHDGCHAPVDRA